MGVGSAEMDPMPRDAITPGSVIVFYDGVCGFCDWAVRFIAPRDTEDRFRFAPLQSSLAAELLLAHDVDPGELDTMLVLVDYGLPAERVFSRAGAVLRVFEELGGFWALLGVFHVLPKVLLDWGYENFAKRRYAIFGKSDHCPLPAPSLRRKFVDAGQTDAPPS